MEVGIGTCQLERLVVVLPGKNKMHLGVVLPEKHRMHLEVVLPVKSNLMADFEEAGGLLLEGGLRAPSMMH